MMPDSILEQFDRAAKDFMFPMLDNGYVYPADVRLSIFSDLKRWLYLGARRTGRPLLDYVPFRALDLHNRKV